MPPTYELLEKHIALLVTTVYCLMYEEPAGDVIHLAFSRAQGILTRELGYPPELVERCLHQLQDAGSRIRRRNFLVKACGSDFVPDKPLSTFARKSHEQAAIH